MKTICLIIYFLLCLGLSATKAQYTKLLDFDSINGCNPSGSLVSDGTFLYGMSFGGGIDADGIIFKIKPDGTGYFKLFDFTNTNGSQPYGDLIYDGTFLYGMTSGGGPFPSDGTIFKIKPDGSGYFDLHDFDGAPNGNSPRGSLILDGTFLYGMTEWGGASGKGNIFKIMPDGTGYLNLMDLNGTNGSYPRGALISDATFLYGMTTSGGANGLGTVFKIKPDGTGYLSLLDFNDTTGGGPGGSLISDGTFLYGMASSVLFKIKPDGTGYSDLHDFTGGADGSQPFGSLVIQGPFLYGMTGSGGTNGKGNVFKIMPNGTGYSDVFDFSGTTDGAYPSGSLISDGTFLYGMTHDGGTDSTYNNGCGVVFKFQSIATGIAGHNTETDFNVFPNPSNGKIEFINKDLEVEKVEIYNLFGEKIYAIISNSQSILINLDALAGVYLYRVVSENGDVIGLGKLIIQK
jgi:uncharacterized repeat protein (TIGR03803 family)